VNRRNFLILLFVLFAVLACKNEKKNLEPEAESPTQSQICYFYGNARCASCFKIEKYTQEVFVENFEDELEFKSFDVSTPENKHFIEDYKLYTQSVILVKIEDGKEIGYQNLDKVWNYLRDEKKFKAYVKGEIDAFLLDKED